MKELIITTKIRDRINNFLGYELIKKVEIGHRIYDEAPGLGKIGIEGSEVGHIFTNKQLDTNGNIEWHKGPNFKAHVGSIKPFHCKLTTISSRKAKILIASLFPEEVVNEEFLAENYEQISELRSNLNMTELKKAS